ncbi:WXG100 family type VII secretion target [Nocardioides sp. YIM 152315]|uniref:WXG100 family type VII secretion target n=1 Tax=Nocardioides sp. YIM 152315 TaxID=3031760 RepID=UPI0023DC6510|nr:WXG100 family type VII secretion target [Nocardioides sp. YIM 152315]MDF1604056.1 WXG100 family type VII secretion target [Nocardioides sp. YIM 152315]
MALGITASHDAFLTAFAGVDAAAGRLRCDRDRVSHRVETLLDGGWRGTAATAYAEGWSGWRDGADQVLAALEAMTSLLRAADADLVETDDDSGSSIALIAARLG